MLGWSYQDIFIESNKICFDFLNDLMNVIEGFLLRLSENVHLLRYPHPSSLRRTSLYASFLGISEALHLDIFRQPLRTGFSTV